MHDRALIICSIWLHVSYIGAASVAIGLVKAFVAETPLASSIALVFGGTALAIAAWDRAYAALEKKHRDEPEIRATSSSSHAAGKARAPASM